VWGDCIPDIVGTSVLDSRFTLAWSFIHYIHYLYIYTIYQLYIPFAKNWVLDNLFFLFLSLCKEKRSVRWSKLKDGKRGESGLA
jgi:hypothetical protein